MRITRLHLLWIATRKAAGMQFKIHWQIITYIFSMSKKKVCGYMLDALENKNTPCLYFQLLLQRLKNINAKCFVSNHGT
jgi:hypothetical protein